MHLKSNFWYKIVYTNGTTLVFQFLEITSDGQYRCRLCDRSEVFNIFSNYSSIVEIGAKSPC